MKTLFLPTLLALLLAAPAVSQTPLVDLVKQGIELHDAGQYEQALAKYKQALKLDTKSPLVHYELGYTYFAMGNYKLAVKHADKAMKNPQNLGAQIYLLKANALDESGQSKKAVAEYREAIKRFPEENMLYFNLGVALYKLKELAGAETAFQNSIQLKLGHASSHFYLGLLKLEQDQRAQGILPLYFFLLLEPDTKRSGAAFLQLKKAFNRGVDRQDEKNISISLTTGGLESEFAAADLYISLLSAQGLMEEEAVLSEEARFAKNTEELLTMLVGMGEDKEGFWWDVYVAFFDILLGEGHAEAFSYYISMSQGEAVSEWNEANKDKMEVFYAWLEEY